MILRSLESIKCFFFHNLYQRVSDYGVYQKYLHLNTINASPYIITTPEYNIHPTDKYSDPNRAQYIISQIESLFSQIPIFYSIKLCFQKGLIVLIV